MATHTPGPWRIDRESDDFEIKIVGKPAWPCTRFGVKGEWDVCQVETDNQDADANLHLIAASPDLLAVACALEMFVRQREDELGCLSHEMEALAALNRAAIARAMGK